MLGLGLLRLVWRVSLLLHGFWRDAALFPLDAALRPHGCSTKAVSTGTSPVAWAPHCSTPLVPPQALCSRLPFDSEALVSNNVFNLSSAKLFYFVYNEDSREVVMDKPHVSGS